LQKFIGVVLPNFTRRRFCGISAAVRSFLPIAAFAVLALAGCASPQQKTAKALHKAEQQMKADNSRSSEQRRMLAMENGDAGSKRGAQILEVNPDTSFDPNKATAAAAHSYGTGKAQTKDFYSGQKVHMDSFKTRDFYDSKANQAAQRKFATKEADTKGKFLNLFARKTAPTKTAPTKEAGDANKAAPTRTLAEGKRPYLGPESKKLNQQTSAQELANWRNTGESVIYTDSTVERVSTLKQLSIDDIRDLLNKSK
jgi:hypothetical protein